MPQIRELSPRCKIGGLFSRRCNFSPELLCGICPKAIGRITRLTDIALIEKYFHRQISTSYSSWRPVVESSDDNKTVAGYLDNGCQPRTPVATITEGKLHLLDTPPQSQ